jgi:hypothetical protein
MTLELGFEGQSCVPGRGMKEDAMWQRKKFHMAGHGERHG